MHGVVQGAISGVTGGSFLSGFLSGVFSSAAGSWAGGGKPGSFRASTGGTLFIGATTGGVGSVLGGGNFWMGAATGLIVTGFNHLMHKMGGPSGGGDGDDSVEYSEKSLKKFAKKYLGDLDYFNKNDYTIDIPEGFEIDSDGYYVNKNTKIKSLAFANPDTGKIHISQRCFNSKYTLYLTIAHETMHKYFYLEYGVSDDLYEHRTIYKWEKELLKNYPINNETKWLQEQTDAFLKIYEGPEHPKYKWQMTGINSNSPF